MCEILLDKVGENNCLDKYHIYMDKDVNILLLLHIYCVLTSIKIYSFKSDASIPNFSSQKKKKKKVFPSLVSASRQEKNKEKNNLLCCSEAEHHFRILFQFPF